MATRIKILNVKPNSVIRNDDFFMIHGDELATGRVMGVLVAVVVATCTGVTTAGVMVNCAFPSVVGMLVPEPSFARTEPESMETFATPADFAVKVMDITLPSVPVKPGFRTIPSNVTDPSLLENVGSIVQSDMMEFDFETEETARNFVGNDIVPDTAFIDWSALETYTLTVNCSPALYVPEDGESVIDAACAKNGRRQNASPAKNTLRKNDFICIFSIRDFYRAKEKQ